MQRLRRASGRYASQLASQGRTGNGSCSGLKLWMEPVMLSLFRVAWTLFVFVSGSMSVVGQTPSSSVSGEYQPWGFNLSGAAFATKPGDDFFRYSNGTWFDRTVIAPDRDVNGVDTVLTDLAEART